MWLSGCRTGGEDVACICTLPCRAGETLSSMHARSTRDMLWLPPCAHAAAQAGGIRRAHRDIRRAQNEQEERTAAAPEEHAESAAAGVERAAARLPHLVLALRAVHSCAPILAPLSARRSANRKLVTSACRTAIACALICQKRLKRDELMRIHQSDTISVGA